MTKISIIYKVFINYHTLSFETKRYLFVKESQLTNDEQSE